MHAHTRLLTLDQHAALWPDLTILNRYVRGFSDDVTVAEHPELGVVIVSHEGGESVISWTTSRPIPAELMV